MPADAQLKACTGAEKVGAGAALGAFAVGRGSSHAMHLDALSGLFVPQMSHNQMSAAGLGGGAIPADAQLNPPEVDATGCGGGARRSNVGRDALASLETSLIAAD